jgi:hypothetical protein
MPDDLKTTRTDLNTAIDSIDDLNYSIKRRTRIFGALGVLTVAGLFFVGIGVRANTERLDEQDDRIEVARDRDLLLAIERCERSNEDAEGDRRLVHWQYEDYNLAPVNQTPERQAFLANRLRQRLAELDRIEPLQDCASLPRPD